jgi:RHS repeat-associated protein
LLAARSLPSPRTHWRKPRRLRRRASGRSFAYNLRFPGQYYQAETGLNYNWNRDYDPLGGGRYIESDPIGLRAGVNTYSYGSANPLTDIDPMGLCKVELRFKHVWNAGGWLGWHAYVVTTDPNGSETISRAGPVGSNAYSGWGNIYAHQDPYDSNSKDWQTDPGNRWDHRVNLVLSQDNVPCDCINKKFASDLDAITNAHIPYYPFDLNSNAVVGTMLRDSGFNVTSAPVFAPGFGVDLNLNYVPSGIPLVSPW